ncbi:MAG: polysaccharide deacetylase family protein [Acidobacteriota bacterium]
MPVVLRERNRVPRLASWEHHRPERTSDLSKTGTFPAPPRSMGSPRRRTVGAELSAQGTHFRVWAPGRKSVAVVLESGDESLASEPGGYFAGLVEGVLSGARYKYRLDGESEAWPDPASRFQPDGSHGHSVVVDPFAYRWQSPNRLDLDVRGLVITEIHIGTFTQEGTFASAIPKLPLLVEAGINTVEVMPLHEFPGRFGWGYDDVDIWAPTRLYGTPDDFRRFVDAAHAAGLAVILDVVYNHFGPDGCYLTKFTPRYFTEKYVNDWGEAINFDDAGSQGVRDFFTENAAYASATSRAGTVHATSRLRTIFKAFATMTLFASLSLTAASREVAVTFDDLPDLDEDFHSVETMEALTKRLLLRIREAHIPAVGFANEDKLMSVPASEPGPIDPRRTALIAAWLDAGLELGNHTWSHMDLHAVTTDRFQEDILRGEAITRPLADAHHRPLLWFRHPYLNTGTSLADRTTIERFLESHGYRVAPVTIDDSEWIFDVAYDRAVAQHHFLTRLFLGRSYIRYMEARFEFAERMSLLMFHREIPQVLLLHASRLNADYFGALSAMMRRRGYRFVPLEDAMSDSAYASPDTWTGGGVGWIERWAVTAGLPEEPFDNDPRVPQWVQRLAGAQEQ